MGFRKKDLFESVSQTCAVIQSSLCAQWVAKGPMFLHADSEDSDRTGQMHTQADRSLRWTHTHFVAFCHVAAQMSLANDANKQ